MRSNHSREERHKIVEEYIITAGDKLPQNAGDTEDESRKNCYMWVVLGGKK